MAKPVAAAEAQAHCAALDLDGGGFRLPEIAEVQTLVDHEAARQGPAAIDPVAFPSSIDVFGTCTGCSQLGVWSATAAAYSPTDYWVIQFSSGRTGSEGTDSSSNLAWCVR